MPTARRPLLFSLLMPPLFWAGARPAAAAGFELVSGDELRREEQHQATLSADDIAVRAPLLRTLQPGLHIVAPSGDLDALRAPLRIEISFASLPGARIVPASFRVLYGLLKIDVTERIRAHARIDHNGVLAEGAVLPPGAHRLFLRVADERGRWLERELRFRVR